MLCSADSERYTTSIQTFRAIFRALEAGNFMYYLNVLNRRLTEKINCRRNKFLVDTNVF